MIAWVFFHSNLSLNTQILALSIKGDFYILQANSEFDYLSDHDFDIGVQILEKIYSFIDELI